MKQKSPEKNAVKIRLVKRSDTAQIAELSGQLGYPSTPAQIEQRFRTLKPASLHAVFIAELPGGKVGGWTHVSVSPQIETDLRAELNALIVADGQRSLGVGLRLLEAAEIWSRKHGCKSMSVRSNVIRDRAHKFYERNGYEHYKTQKAFRKPL
jgi:GNAT superfamily N-acetyltransferase